MRHFMRTLALGGALAALGLNATWAMQSVPHLEDGHWLLPPPEVVGMGPDPVSAQYGYEQAASEACQTFGCDASYLLSILYCESNGDPNAWHANPSGGADVGVMQINDATWGDIAYAGPTEQIWWSAQMLAAGQGYLWLCG